MITIFKIRTSILIMVLMAAVLPFTMTSCVGGNNYTEEITTTEGNIRGIESDEMFSYKGIPYAAAPVGDLRFAPPENPAARAEILDAFEFGSSCPQAGTEFGEASTDEDCLFLNIFTPPDAESGDNLPVMVWIHGGAFIYGAGSLDGYNPIHLIEKDVIVVTINYRLGALGFLPLAELAAEQGGHAGNYGLLDQQKALEWLQANITAFGGNPGNVTIFGESAGGHSVLSHLVSPTSTGLFDKAIIESGGFGPTQVDQTTIGYAVFGNPFLTIAGIAASPDIPAALRAMSVEDILDAQNTFLTTSGSTMYMPVYDASNDMLTDSILNRLTAGTFANVPVMHGCNLNEGELFVLLDLAAGTLYSTEAEYYTTGPEAGGVYTLLVTNPLIDATDRANIAAAYLADAITELGSPTHANRFRVALSKLWTDYMFTYNTQAQWQLLSANGVNPYAYWFTDVDAPNDWDSAYLSIGATHSLEIQYVFGLVGDNGGSAAQETLSESMMTYWTDFAKNGSPGTGWDAFDVLDGAAAVVKQLDTPEADVTLADFCAVHKCTDWNGWFVP